MVKPHDKTVGYFDNGQPWGFLGDTWWSSIVCGLVLKDTNGARINIFLELFFEEMGEGKCIGLYIYGLFVVDKIVKDRSW